MITAINTTSTGECFDCLSALGRGPRLRRRHLVERMGGPAFVCGHCLTPEELQARDMVSHRAGRPASAPSRAEIEERAAEIRAGWTAGETRRRLRADWRLGPWEAPSVIVSPH